MGMRRTRVKVCGITSIEAAMAAVDAGADAIGFVFVEGTPRYIDPDRAVEIMYGLPPFVSTVGVCGIWTSISSASWSTGARRTRCSCTVASRWTW